jgi:sugar/nucleoside kinase (ribokinase family)
MIDVVTIGWLTVDDVVLTNGTCRQHVPGGGALYSAIGAKLWVDGVGINSVAGRPYAEMTKREIEARGISTEGIGETSGNGLELWLLHETATDKQQVPKLSSSPAHVLDEERKPLPPYYGTARGFHIAPQSPPSSIANAERLGGGEGRMVTMDILSDTFIDATLYKDLSFLRFLTAFLPSEAEIKRIWRPSSIETWLIDNAKVHKCHMVAKLGERGSLVCESGSGNLTHVPALPVAATDTTGAGDGFCGGFVAGLTMGKSPIECAAMATVSSSYVVEAFGALATPTPTPEDRLYRLQLALERARPFRT